MNIINWFITPKEYILKGDVILSAEELFEKLPKDSKNRVDLSGIVYEYKDLGKLKKCIYSNKKYIVTTKRGEVFNLDLDHMDRYFVNNHLKNTLDYLKKIQT